MITSFSCANFVVPDLERVAGAYCRAYGMGPWKYFPLQEGRCEESGEIFSVLTAECEFTNITLRLIQPVSGKSIYRDFLDRSGAGLHHLTVKTACPFEEAVEVAKTAGTVAMTAHYPDGVCTVCVDHISQFGTCLEFVSQPAGYVRPQPLKIDTGAGQGKYGFDVERPMITKLMQLCFVVPDRWAAIKTLYDVYGVGAWSFHIIDKESASDVVFNGKEITADSRANVCNSTSIQLEIIQPLDQVDNYYDLLRRRGPCLHHICMDTANKYEQALEVMDRDGHPTARTCIMDKVEKCAHTDHLDTFGCYFELVFRDADFVPPIHEMYPPWAKPLKPTSLKPVF